MVFEEKLSHFPARALEWFGSWMLTTWGVYVLLHPNLFQRDGNKPSIFDGLSLLADQNVWGIAALSGGIIRFGALYVNGAHTRTPAIRLFVSFLSIFFWFWICVGLWKSGVATTGWSVYPWLCVADMYSAYRAASDVYEAEAQRRVLNISNRTTEHAGISRS